MGSESGYTLHLERRRLHWQGEQGKSEKPCANVCSPHNPTLPWVVPPAVDQRIPPSSQAVTNQGPGESENEEVEGCRGHQPRCVRVCGHRIYQPSNPNSTTNRPIFCDSSVFLETDQTSVFRTTLFSY